MPPSLEVRLLGPLVIGRDGRALTLPASRKVRALFAYLALAPHAVGRSQLCELLWDVPDDPRGELRWCLSKIRGLVDDPGQRRVTTPGDAVELDLSDCFVDAIEITRAAQEITSTATDRLRELVALFAGDFLEGLEIDRSPTFEGWLAGQRRRFRARLAALLEELVAKVPDEEALGYLERWLEIAPFDRRVHELLLGQLARHRRIREGEEHLAATIQRFEAEGLDAAPIRDAWRAARAHGSTPPRPVGAAATAAGGPDPGACDITSRRGSVAVMPFVDFGVGTATQGGIAGALAHDIITRLAKLRSLFVIAHGSVLALHERRIGPEDAGRMFDVDYVVGGSLRRRGGRLTVSVELTETRTARIIWADVFDRKSDATFLVLDEIGDRIVASVANEIETAERNRAILKPPSSLDAWEAHHRGLWHMYRFNRADNDLARHFFEMALRLDPTFAGAYAGLSFTHFQNAFQGWAERDRAIDDAYAAAGQSVMVDDRDPSAHWAMGRALWLKGKHDQSIGELQQAVDLSPNFALAHYTLAFVQSQAGDAPAAIACSDRSRRLSPFDPLLFGMLGSRAMALVRLEQFADAASWAVKAAARPNAHPHILAIAAYSLALAGSQGEAASYAAAIRKARPSYRAADFLSSFKFDPHGAALFRQGARLVGMAD